MKKIIFIVVIVLFLVCAGLTIGKMGFGTGDGSGDGNQSLDISAEKQPDEEQPGEEPQDEEVIIRVEENKIYVGEEECADIKDLIDRISKINSQGKNAKYVFEHEYAIKATYDEVRETLKNLEETLGISIDYGR